jgi:hypothetical protein
MKLKDLKKRGAFVQGGPVEKELRWKHLDPESGEEVEDVFTIAVKRQSFGDMERVVKVDPDDPERSRNAAMISESILLGDDEGGEFNERMSYAEAYSLAPGLARLFIDAILEVNGSAGPKR